ncbi:MAG: tRNA (adenosine(37)-N6)-dimethylallyltransferase MiaA [Patescibacteria group bacterium]
MTAPAPKLIVILGPTATGKTKLAAALAFKYGGKIISADSRQVFCGMDIGTGKDLADYYISSELAQKLKSSKRPASVKSGLKPAQAASDKASGTAIRGHQDSSKVPYALIDIIEPMTAFNVAKYQKLAKKAIGEAVSQGYQPFLVGGTGLYIDAIIKGYQFNQEISAEKQKQVRNKLDKLSLTRLLARLKKVDPITYQKIDQKNRRRVQRALEIYEATGRRKSETDKKSGSDYDLLIIGLKFSLEEIYRRIDSRLETRIKEGMIKEIKKLRRQGVSWKRLEEFGLEYRYVSRYLRGLISYEEMLGQLKNEIHHFAKRQLTWFKRNKDIVWVTKPREAERAIAGFLKK